MKSLPDAHLVDTVKKVEIIVGRLRLRRDRSCPSSTAGTSTGADQSLSLVEKARMLKSRASRLARRVQVDKTDETASTSESLTRSGPIPTDDSDVRWYHESMAYEDYGEI